MNNILLLIITLLSLLIILFSIIKHFFNVSELNNIIKQKDSEINNLKRKFNIKTGDRVLFKFSLKYKNVDTFSVLYEADVLQFTDKKIKVIALDYTSDDTIANDPNHKIPILNFMKNKWIDLDKVEKIFDISYNRSEKIKQLI